MKKSTSIIIAIAIIFIAAIIITYNGLVSKQEQVSKSWGQVQATYQRRVDLIPNLVATVKGYAAHEKSTLLEVTQARSVAYKSLNAGAPQNAEQLKQFMASQGALSQALGKLMVVVERYPDLKASQNFLALQNQLEGTENRITVAREDFNNATQTFNVAIRRFPANIVANMFGNFKETPYFKAQTNAAKAPTVSF